MNWPLRLDIRKGGPIRAVDILAIIERVNRGISARGAYIDSTGIYIRPTAFVVEGEKATKVTSLLLAESANTFGDYLECRSLDSEPEEYDPILVAKPWNLRQSTYDGKTIDDRSWTYEYPTRRIDHDELNRRPDEIQIILPVYFVGGVIEVIPADTDVFVGEGEERKELKLRELSSREWAAVYYTTLYPP